MSSRLHEILGGSVRSLLGDQHEVRPEQLSMAEAVARTMQERSHLIAEAGTGVGKSFAYLLPAMLRCLAGETVVIATHTIALQEQLVNKDIPLLLRALGIERPKAASDGEEETLTEVSSGAQPLDHGHDGHDGRDGQDGQDGDEESRADVGDDEFGFPLEVQPGYAFEGDAASAAPPPAIRPVLVKGRGNYVSLRRLKLASLRQERLFSDPVARRSLHAIEDWASSTRDGTLSSLPQLERPGVWDKVVSDSGNCMGRRCPTYKICFYQQARRVMEAANLLVCNHALYFADLALRAQDIAILPKYHHVVLDEAHTIEDVASEHFGITLTERRISFLLASLHHPKSGRGMIASLELVVGDAAVIDRAVVLVSKVQDASRAFFESLIAFAEGEQEQASETSQGMRAREGRGQKVCRVRRAGAVPNILSPMMRELALRLQAMKTLCKSEADVFELNSYAQRAEMIAQDADALLAQTLADYAYWIDIGGNEEDDRFARAVQRVELACAPIEVGPILRERLFRQEFSVTMTSATLATRTTRADESTESAETAFSHFISRVGCEGARAFQAGSPFDYARQVRVYVPQNLSLGLPQDVSRSYNETLAHHILHHIKETQGGAFVLFTSFAMLNAMASLLVAPLSALGFPMLAQGRDGSRTAILDRFRQNENSVLLGAASFWQGVDVRGRGLRNVIITKLPFDPPDRPLTQARLELIEQRGGNPFMEDSLPRAVIKFKQGFGRLIRSKTDEGRVVVLDPRVMTARYGRLFLAALPPGVRVLPDGSA